MNSRQTLSTEPIEAANGRAGRRRVLESLLNEVSRIYEVPAFRELYSVIVECRAKLEAGKINLAVLGQMKRGKSSLLNALLREDLLPTGILPLTSVVTEISYADHASATILYRTGNVWDIPLEDVPQYVTEAGNPGNRKGVARLILRHPSPLLRAGIVLVDTPGLGSTYAHNTDATREYLGHIDAAIIVFSVDPPITEAEAEFVKDLRNAVPSLVFVLNKTDLATEQEVAKLQNFLRDELVNRLGVPSDSEIFPVSSRRIDGKTDAGLEDFVEYLQYFAMYKQDQTLFRSILRDVQKTLALASFSLSIGCRLSSLSPAELEERRLAIQDLLVAADSSTTALKTLLRQEQADLFSRVGRHLDGWQKEVLPQLQDQFESFRLSHPALSGKRLGKELEGFLNQEMDSIFRDWRMREDAELAGTFNGAVAEYTSKAQLILNTLTQELETLTGLRTEPLRVHCGIAVDAKVSYVIERVYFSLDRFFLMLPPFLQRPLVYRRVQKSVPLQLDRNAGRVRFDYRERIERSFASLERMLLSQIELARQSLTAALRSSEGDGELLHDVTALQSYVDRLVE